MLHIYLFKNNNHPSEKKQTNKKTEINMRQRNFEASGSDCETLVSAEVS